MLNSTYPADLGAGFIVLDWICVVGLLLAGVINGYLAVYRVNSPSGVDLVARRMVAVGFMGQGMNLAFRMWQAGGDLLVSPQAEFLYILVAIGSCLLGINRVRFKRDSLQ